MITKKEYLAKIDRERDRVTENVINAIRNHIETCAEGKPIVEEYILDEYEKKYFKEVWLIELEKEYPFLKFEISFNTIEWRLK